ncbi:MAG TPA: RHS repeat-associated core domain-containing protein [Kofleriaceae bacterium]|nr:RHS repeat-associated core domain-containing protein [Kofleriaceae bacterium]
MRYSLLVTSRTGLLAVVFAMLAGCGSSSSGGNEDGGGGSEDAGTDTDGGTGDGGTPDGGVPTLDVPPLPTMESTSFAAATSFLYSGANPIQTGVQPGTIQPEYVAVLRGKVADAAGQPLPGVQITVLNHPELGQTLTRSDGHFDLAVNGGALLTLNYSKGGHLPLQRATQTPWQEYLVMPDVVMVQLDPAVTNVSLGASTLQVARGSTVTDDDGSRQAMVLVPASTTATMVLPNGTEMPLASMDLRVTEYTVGASGPQAMPGLLPPTSGYTYAAEFSVDQAIAAGANEVKFSQALPVYIDNFLDFPTGTPVPSGSYDRLRGRWVAEESGVVVKVLSVAGGSATLDVTGDDVADAGAALTDLGISTAELQHLATAYPAGKTLWRVALAHFSPWDFNWPFGPPNNAVAPHLSNPNPNVIPNKRCGSIIGCENQSLGEVVPITGSEHQLHYNSDQVSQAANVLDIPLSGSSLPDTVTGIQLVVSVAGQQLTRSFPAATNQSFRFVFDGKDGYGRELFGRQKVSVAIGYVYNGVYEKTRRFGYNGNGLAISGSRERATVVLWLNYDSIIGSVRNRALHAKGWSLSNHHVYSPESRELLLGNGERRWASQATISTVAGTGVLLTYSDAVDTGPALTTKVGEVQELATGPDGSIYFTDGTDQIKRLSPQGDISVFAGKRSMSYPGNITDGIPATSADMTPEGMTFGPDGTLYFVDRAHNLIRKVNRDGTVQTVAGKLVVKDMYGQWQSTGDGGPALAAQIRIPWDVVVGADGTFYFSEVNRIRRVGTDGIITTVVGDGSQGSYCGVTSPTGAGVSPRKLALGRDGSLYYTTGDAAVCRMSPVGRVTIVTGWASENYGSPIVALADGAMARDIMWPQFQGIDDLVMAADDSLLVLSTGLGRVFRIDPEGAITRVAGSTAQGFAGDGGSARDARLSAPRAIAVAVDSTLVIGDTSNYRIRQVKSSPTAVQPSTEAKHIIAAQDGSEVYSFDDKGRHLDTREALTGAVRYAFTYDAEGFLSSVTDGANRTTVIERASDKAPTAIVAPGGQRTTLVTAAEQLVSVSNPAAESYTMTYGADGLLASYTRPAGATSSFTYDADGYLRTDTDAAGGTITLARTTSATGYSVTATTGLGRVHTYRIERLPTGELRSSVTDAAGAVTTRSTYLGGNELLTLPNGSTMLTEYAPDPRWGMAAPYPRRIEATTPGGRTRIITMTRTATVSDVEDPFSLTAFVEQRTEGTMSRTKQYSPATRTLTRATAEGRVSGAILDALGRVVTYSPGAGITAIERTYDASGRLSAVQQGTSATTFTYDASNRLTQVRRGTAPPTEYAYDLADRVSRLTLPSGRAYDFTYNADGQSTGVVMPNGKTHALAFSAAGRDLSYTPPESSTSLSWTYDPDGAWTGSTLPDGTTLSASYDTAGRASGRGYSSGTAAYGYADSTTRITSINKTPAMGTAQQIGLTYDAELVTAMSWSGVANGQFTYAYDDRTLLSGVTLSSGSVTSQIATTYDNDGLVTQRGPFTFTRSGPMGGVSQISDSVLDVDIAYAANGRIAQRSVAVGASTPYSANLTYDDAGRVSRRVESVGGTPRTIDYAYDADGQLVEVRHGGAVVESYGYDANGNRTTPAATYDAQDRQLTLGGTSNTFDASGFLRMRGSDSFQYSARGELLVASVGGQTVSYSYDGLGRRVGRRVGAAATGDEYFYGNLGNPFQLSAARTAAGTLQVFHYDPRGLLIAIQQGGAYYYVATDEVGTPRIVTDASGAIVKQLDYDSYGVLRSDSAPAFELPIGYAGGLADNVTRLVRFGYRDYDPAAGRWLARDPALYGGLQLNLYAYVGNNPIGRTDPAGLFTIGGSAYLGPGGGLKLTVDSTGFVICGELGFGGGGSIDVDPFEEVGDVDVKPSIIGEAGFGPLGVGLEISGVGDCFSIDPSFKVGPIKGKFEGITTANPSGVEFSNFDLPLKAEAKIAGQVCGGMKF